MGVDPRTSRVSIEILTTVSLDFVDELGGIAVVTDHTAGRIAKLWSYYLETPITPADVANMMIMLKVARLRHTPGVLDSWLDIAGYAACGAEVSVS